jgi:RNA polymerase sigma factor for flagellar operon FliA
MKYQRIAALTLQATPGSAASTRRPRLTTGVDLMPSGEPELWRCYRTDGDLEARDRLVERHLPLVRAEARRVQRGVVDHAQFDDLMSAGALGLLEALERYDPARGWQFSTFAMRRIKGAMLDHLRYQAGVPRGARVLARRIGLARAKVEGRVGRRACETEIAEELGVPTAEYHSWHQSSVRAVVPLIADVAAPANGQGDEDRAGPPWLSDAIQRLPPRERTVIRLGFFEDQSGREVAQALGVSEARVSQLRGRALSRLRDAGPIQVAV